MSELQAYKAFRQDFLKKVEKNLYRRDRSDDWLHEEDREHPWRAQRMLIRFRLSAHAADRQGLSRGV